MNEQNPFDEDALWREAHRIAWVGASNPAVAATSLGKWTQAVITGTGNTEAAKQHPALRAMAGQVAFLFGQALGADDESANQLEKNCQRLGLI
jgi:hypothetical protein